MRLLNSSKIEVLLSDALTQKAKDWAMDNWTYLTEVNTPLVNVNSSTKIKKGEKINLETAILYLKPAASISAITLCAASELFGCEDDCLESSGQLGMTTADNAKIKRTIIYVLRKFEFLVELEKEIKRKAKLALKHDADFAVRLNGTSDIDFSRFIGAMPEIQFYDYTKIYRQIKKNDLPNYDLTFSGSANNDKTLRITARAIANNLRTVLAINTAETKGEYKLPNNLGLIPLINMDETDARFYDDKSAVGVLARKGSNKTKRAADENRNNFFFNKETLEKLEREVA